MAKNTCAICGAEVDLFTGQQPADKTYVCCKVCAKIWNQIFVHLQKTKVKEEKATAAAESLGTYLEGDRIELIAKADAALAKVQY